MEVGLIGEVSVDVTAARTAAEVGSGTVAVFATPELVRLCEAAAVKVSWASGGASAVVRVRLPCRAGPTHSLLSSLALNHPAGTRGQAGGGQDVGGHQGRQHLPHSLPAGTCTLISPPSPTQVEVKHLAATPVGMTVTGTVKLREVQKGGRLLIFDFEATDGVDKVGEGTHERFVVGTDKFLAGAQAKLDKAKAAAEAAK